MSTTKPITYADAGVDVEKGYKAVELIKKHSKSTFNKNVLSDLGSFGGLYSIANENLKEPVLVSGTDGVGTKLKYAFIANKHDTIGIDCVAMCVNDVVCHGAKPLFFLDYLATGKLEPEKAAEIVGGIAEGCRQAGSALIGGETAEMPGFYEAGEYDMAGFCVGIVDKSKIINGSDIKVGDSLIGIASSGIHSNGFSLIRKLFGEDKKVLENTKGEHCSSDNSLLDEFLIPTKIYVKTVLHLVDKFNIKGIAHITGGGFIENIPRIFPKGIGGVVELSSYKLPTIFEFIKEKSGLSDKELYNTFNMGIGLVLCVDKKDEQTVLAELKNLGEPAFVIGKTISGEGLELR